MTEPAGEGAAGSPKVKLTIRSLAMRSSSDRRVSVGSPVGSRMMARARNRFSPDMGALVHSEEKSSTLTEWRARVWEI